MADLSPGVRSRPSQQSLSRSARKLRPSPSSPARTTPSQSKPGRTDSTWARSGPSENWKRKRSSKPKKRSAFRLSLVRRSTRRSFQSTMPTRRAYPLIARPRSGRRRDGAAPRARAPPRPPPAPRARSPAHRDARRGRAQRDAPAHETRCPVGHGEGAREAVGRQGDGAAARLEGEQELTQPFLAPAVEPVEPLRPGGQGG